jgi:hypothetical protein
MIGGGFRRDHTPNKYRTSISRSSVSSSPLCSFTPPQSPGIPPPSAQTFAVESCRSVLSPRRSCRESHRRPPKPSPWSPQTILRPPVQPHPLHLFPSSSSTSVRPAVQPHPLQLSFCRHLQPRSAVPVLGEPLPWSTTSPVSSSF